jgi:hypothetical protein
MFMLIRYTMQFHIAFLFMWYLKHWHFAGMPDFVLYLPYELMVAYSLYIVGLFIYTLFADDGIDYKEIRRKKQLEIDELKQRHSKSSPNNGRGVLG